MKVFWFALQVTVITCYSFTRVESLNILGIFPLAVKSHFFVFQPYLAELAQRGHNLTVISYYPRNEPLANYTDIDLGKDSPPIQASHPISDSFIVTLLTFTLLHALAGPVMCRMLMENEDVQNFLVTDTKFDLVIVEQFNSDCSLAIAHKMRAPIVGITSHMVLPWHYQRFGIPYNPSTALYDYLRAGTKTTLMQRVQRILMYNYVKLVQYYITQRLEQNIISEYMDDIPSLDALGKNIKLLLVYQNFVLSGSSILPANVIEVGGFHVSKPKSLPDDLRKYIEESDHGVIFISFGSILKPTSMPKDKLLAIIEALEMLEQRVIWKWGKKDLPGSPKNIMVTKWLPQNDVLAHPNVLAFISHCGKLGITEAMYHGVPVIGVPIFGDQPSNAAAIEESGLGVQITMSDLTKDRLLEKIKMVLCPRSNVKMLSKAWHDRPIKPMDTAIFWTEFAARHNVTFSAPTVPTYEYFGLDVISVLLISFILTATIIKYMFILIKSICYRCLKKYFSQIKSSKRIN